MSEPKPQTPPKRKLPGDKKPVGDPPSTRKPRIAQSKQQAGGYGNDQFAAEHHDTSAKDRELPEGLRQPQKQPRNSQALPTTKSKEQRYGRIGDQGKG